MQQVMSYLAPIIRSTLIFIKEIMLKSIIKTRGVKQKWLAAKLGVSEVTVSNWCSGKTTPNEEHLIKLSVLLEVEPTLLKQ